MKSKPNVSGSTRKQSGLLACSRLDKIAKDSHCQPKVHHQAVESENHSINNSDSCLPTSYDDIEHSEVVGLADIFPDVSLLVTSSYLPDEAFSPPLELKECIWQELLFSCPVAGCEYTALPALVSDDSEDNCTISCDEKHCNSENFHVTDGTAVGPVGLSADEDLGEPISSSVVGCEYMIPEMLPAATEGCMLLPFLEEIAEASRAKSLEEALVSSDDACLFLALQEAMSQEAIVHSSYEGLDYVECFDPELLIANFSELPEVFPSYLPVSFPMQMGKRKPNTLVLDLDETLIHSSLDHCPEADFSFPVCVNMREHIVYVRQRPHLHTFLEKVAEMFEIVIFTASQSIYADQLLNTLDPDNKIISQRVYREACVVSDGRYVKDLTVLRRDLAKVVIVDNTPQVFQLQVNNGIPIQSWFDDPTDCALLSILPFLEILASADDVRPFIANRFST